MITAANAIKGAAVIAVAKPHLAGRISKHLLRAEKATYATPECRHIAIGHALQALKKMIGLLDDPRAARRFDRDCSAGTPARRAGTLAGTLGSASTIAPADLWR